MSRVTLHGMKEALDSIASLASSPSHQLPEPKENNSLPLFRVVFSSAMMYKLSPEWMRFTCALSARVDLSQVCPVTKHVRRNNTAAGYIINVEIEAATHPGEKRSSPQSGVRSW